MTRVECEAMIESKMCEYDNMNCDDNGCSFSKKPIGEYTWFKEKTFYGFECSFHKKFIIGQSLEKSLFSFHAVSSLL